MTAALAALLAVVPAASASISPSLTLSQSSANAGSTANLGMDLKFSPTGSDSPKDLTVSLPAGLLANASIDGGACLTATSPVAACQVGSGTVSASETLLGIPVPVPLSLPVGFYLVAPPKPGDLAGLQMTVNRSRRHHWARRLTSPCAPPAPVKASG